MNIIKNKISKLSAFDFQDNKESTCNFFELAKKNFVKKGKNKEDLALSIDKVLYGGK